MTLPRVLIVHNRYLQAGGEDVAVTAEAELLAARGHAVCRLETSNEELINVPRLRVAARTIWNGQGRLRLAQLQARFRPDIIHFHNTFPLLSPAVYYAREGAAAVVQTLHNYRLVCPPATLMRQGRPCEDCVGRFAWRGVVHACYRGSRGATLTAAAMVQTHRALGTWARHVDAYIALTPFARDVFTRGGLPAEKIFVKPNFVAPDPGIGSRDGDHFVFVGRLEEGKGVRVLLDAWQRLKQPPPLWLIGTGPLEAEVAHRAAAQPSIRLAGHLPRAEVFDHLKRARALIAPLLWYENFPLSLCEAMATGCPILASDVGNIRDLVGAAGLGFRAGDAAALAQLVERLDERELNQASAAGRSLYEAHYTADVNYEQLRGVYEQAVRARAVVA